MITKTRLHEINFSRILRHIRLNGGISRIAAARDLELDRSTLTKAVRAMIACGIVRETGKFRGKPGSGRMAIGLEIDPSFGCVLGMEIQTQTIRWTLMDLCGAELDSGATPFGGAETRVDEAALALFRAVNRRESAAGRRIIGIGIGLSGSVNQETGEIIYSYPLGITSPLALRDRVAEGAGLPAFVENDANCCCWGEIAFGDTLKSGNFIAILGEFRNVDVAEGSRPGVAVGMGISVNRRVMPGDNCNAGEFRSLLYDHSRPSRSQFSITDEQAALLPGDADTLGKVFGELGYNVSLLVNVLDVNRILVAGDFADHASLLTDKLTAEIRRNSLYQIPRACEILYSPHGENAVCAGAAGLFMHNLFSVPGMSNEGDENLGLVLLSRILSSDELVHLREALNGA
ncbi:MAG TPA: ROK family transcriptional regulator [Treponemataceae bacterium]|nr:ROK family transcriptional regulator [Treponemataceae bacterium]